LGKRYGDQGYAFEELVAEMGAAFLCATVESPYATQHASYISNWVQVVKDHSRAIFTAAGKAQAAMDFILKKTFEESDFVEATPDKPAA
jgi:antirestriction protein ArdC